MVARDLSVVGLPRSVVTQETLLDAADQLENADTADGASLIRERSRRTDAGLCYDPDLPKSSPTPSGEMSALDLPASTGATKSPWRI